MEPHKHRYLLGAGALGEIAKSRDTEATRQNVVDDARNTMHEARALASKIIGLADRLLGATPTADGSAGAPTPAAGELDRFRAEMRDTRQAMIFADDALTRIEQELIG